MNKIFFVLIIFILAVSAFAQDEVRTSKTWEVQKYDIAATLPGGTERDLSAKAVLSLKNVSSRAAATLTLRISPSATVSVVKVNDAAADFTKNEEKVGAGTLQRIVVRVASVQPNGNLNVAVDYKFNVKENSGLNALSPLNSQFLPLSYWYPTPNNWFFSQGADFAPVHLQVSSSGGETIIASGTQSGNAFEQKLLSQPFFVAGSWDKIDANGVTVFVPKDSDAKTRADELAALASEAKNFTATLLGNAPNVPLRIVAVKRGGGFSDGGTIFVDESVFRRQKIDAQTVMNIAEAVAKIWLGNAVAVGGDGYGVIREGLAQFIATQFLESKYGKEIADVERLRQRTAYAAIVKRDAPLTQISPVDDYFYTSVSNKGAMIWRLLAKQVGQEEFFKNVQAQMKDGNLTLNKIRAAFPAQKNLLDNEFDQITEMNLLVGLPQTSGAETKVALRNLGEIDAIVSVLAITQSGERLTAQATIPTKSFGEASFRTTNKIARVEIDTDKLYPQTDYSDDVAPREFDSSDAIAVIKRFFDQQDFAKAEKSAGTILQTVPRFDDARIWLARSLAAQNKNADAEKEFRAALDEKLPTARTLAWANAGLGDIALKNNQNAQAGNFFAEAIRANGEYGATLAARAGLNKTGATAVDESVKSFFAQFDKAAVSGRKADVEALVLPGEITRFAASIAGQAQEWTTKVARVDKLDANNALAEVNLNVRLLNKNAESGTAVFLLSKIGGNWKLSGVEIFEIR